MNELVMILTSFCLNLSTTSEVTCVANLLSKHYDIDPLVSLSVIEVESAFNPKAKGKAGEVGLMQLKPKFFPTVTFDIRNNLYLGIKHLKEMKQKCGNGRDISWVVCHNTGVTGLKKIKDPKQTMYYKKVKRAYEKISYSWSFVSDPSGNHFIRPSKKAVGKR